MKKTYLVTRTVEEGIEINADSEKEAQEFALTCHRDDWNILKIDEDSYATFESADTEEDASSLEFSDDYNFYGRDE